MQIVYSITLFVVGVIFAQTFLKSLAFSFATGYMWGVLLSIVPAFLSLVILGEMSMDFCAISGFVLFFVLLGYAKKQGVFASFLSNPGLSTSVFFSFSLIVFALSKWNFSMGSTDSLNFVIRPAIHLFGGAFSEIVSAFSTTGVFLPLAHGMVLLWGDEYYYLLHPLIFFSIYTLFFWLF